MGNLTRLCVCGAEISNWRSCPIKGCSHETVYCPSCGDDTIAMKKMQQHIFGEHTDSVVSRKALIAFRARLLMRHYRDLPNGLDLGYMVGYLFLRNPITENIPEVLRGEILPDVEISQSFRWIRVAKGGNWEGYHALVADEPDKTVEAIIPAEVDLGW
jgi:hypothetical protein